MREPIRPLQDVWLRPRRVFRELALQPIGVVDYLLGAAQGMVGWLGIEPRAKRRSDEQRRSNLRQGLVSGLALPASPVCSSWVRFIRVWGSRVGGTSARNPVFHVLAYGGVPIAGSLGLWLLTALLAGEATFMQAPRADVEGFIALVLRLQFVAYVLLTIWSVVLQVMGFSEIEGLATRKAFGMWLLGQLIGLLAVTCLTLLLILFLPNAGSS